MLQPLLITRPAFALVRDTDDDLVLDCIQVDINRYYCMSTCANQYLTNGSVYGRMLCQNVRMATICFQKS